MAANAPNAPNAPSLKWRGTNLPIGTPGKVHIEWDWYSTGRGWRYAYESLYSIIPFQQICRGPTKDELVAKAKEPESQMSVDQAAHVLLSQGIGVNATRQEPLYVLPADDAGGLWIG